MSIRFGRAITSVLPDAEEREWLVTNGIGGYASGTIAGSITRGYHGVLVAALRPPVDRRLMCVKLDESFTYRGASYDGATNRWTSGAVAPDGTLHIESFELVGGVPTWRFALADAVVDKRVWMEYGKNTTWIEWTVVAAEEPIRVSARAIVDNRVFHNTGETAWPAEVTAVDGGVRVVSGGEGARPLVLLASEGDVQIANDRYEGFALPAERERGLRDTDDHLHAATFQTTLRAGDAWLVLASAEDAPAIDRSALGREQQRAERVLEDWVKVRPSGPWPDWSEQLVRAADQFVVSRWDAQGRQGRSVIAGYPWFEDWGRDTMISLPGLTLATGRAADAAPILRTFADFLDQGMLPNRFPDGTDAPEYNTIDATLWYFQAIRAYHEATGDDDILRELWPKLRGVIDWHINGTRYGIGVDPTDGLLRGGQEGVQLTWMDAKVGDHVITPRIGKPVEVNALWYNALVAMARFAQRLGLSGDEYSSRADWVARSFQRFWSDDLGHCFDVLDGPAGNDAKLRPNQLLALSLPEPLLNDDQRAKVLLACGGALLTSHGLRTLAASDPDYEGVYGGGQSSRDGAYHQGTVWAWLIGPYISAHLKVHRDPHAALRVLEALGDHVAAAGLGSVSEIFDGDAPFTPRGCIAQAWSVAELLRATAEVIRALAATTTRNEVPT